MSIMFKGWCCSTDCRHRFCGGCLFTWWSDSRKTECPSCRFTCQHAPVLDCLNGLASLVSVDTEEAVEPFDGSKFEGLMAEIRRETRMADVMEDVEVLDYWQVEGVGLLNEGFLEDAGTLTNPVDLTAIRY